MGVSGLYLNKHNSKEIANAILKYKDMGNDSYLSKAASLIRTSCRCDVNEEVLKSILDKLAEDNIDIWSKEYNKIDTFYQQPVSKVVSYLHLKNHYNIDALKIDDVSYLQKVYQPHLIEVLGTKYYPIKAILQDLFELKCDYIKDNFKCFQSWLQSINVGYGLFADGIHDIHVANTSMKRGKAKDTLYFSNEFIDIVVGESMEASCAPIMYTSNISYKNEVGFLVVYEDIITTVFENDFLAAYFTQRFSPLQAKDFYTVTGFNPIDRETVTTVGDCISIDEYTDEGYELVNLLSEMSMSFPNSMDRKSYIVSNFKNEMLLLDYFKNVEFDRTWLECICNLHGFLLRDREV